MNNDIPAYANLTSSRDILAENFDQIRLAFDSLKRDRDRLNDVIFSLRVNAIKGDEPEALIAFMRDGLGGVDEGLTIGEMVCAYGPANTRTTSLAAQDGLVEALAQLDFLPWKKLSGHADDFRAALDALGFEIREKGND